MLKPLTNWNALRHALDTFRKRIWICEDCGYPWIGNAATRPLRCANERCRAWADAPKRDRVGRPSAVET